MNLIQTPEPTVVLPFAMKPPELLAALGVPDRKGLSNEEAAHRQASFGFNELQETPPEPRWRKFVAQFNELVIWILIIGAVISAFLGEWVDATAILAIVILNGVLGFLQEERAEQALSALQGMSAPMAKVRRNAMLKALPAREIVPGDILELEAGDNVPADVRLIETYSFSVQESALTGESLPVKKDATAVLAESTALGDRRTMAYMGTIAVSGKAEAVAVTTGMQTELGKIAGLLQHQEPEPTPLQRRLAELGRVLVVICLAIVAVVFVLQLSRGGSPFEVFMLAVGLAVAAVPEGLPAVVTMALALGLQRMVRRNALVRKLPSVETLGSVTVICSDKTGTLTRNEMTVRRLYVSGRMYEVSGAGYAPHGEFRQIAMGDLASADQTQPFSDLPVDVRIDSDLRQALTIGAWCNNAQVLPKADSNAWQVVGDPTEGALIVAAMKAGIETRPVGSPIAGELPFDSERKAMSVLVAAYGANPMLQTKGAPEVVLRKCSRELRGGKLQPLDNERRQEILAINAQLAGQALRVLALAFRDDVQAPLTAQHEEQLIFAGLVGMIDPPRDEVRTAVQTCRRAGIRPIMITGDHPATATAVARELGILGPLDRILTGGDLDKLDDKTLAEQVSQIAVYARVSAEHKLRVVRAWKTNGETVAMTGDGVNDAPAVKAADIGIAMGVSGTDVTKAASDMVLTDDNFASIVSAVEEGRGIYDNIQKVLIFLLSCNLGEILVMLMASLLGWPAPLVPIHLLWINLVTDGLPALALVLEPPEPGVMDRKPRDRADSILSAGRGVQIVWQGMLVGAAPLAGFAWAYLSHPEDIVRARTIAFCVLVYAELFRAFAARSQRFTLFELGIASNPYLFAAIAISGLLQVAAVTVPFSRPVFETVMHPWNEWGVVLLLALCPVTFVELGKYVARWGTKSDTQIRAERSSP